MENKKVRTPEEIKQEIREINDKYVKAKLTPKIWAEKVKALTIELNEATKDEKITMTQDQWAAHIKSLLNNPGGVIDRVKEAAEDGRIVEIKQTMPREIKDKKVILGEFLTINITYRIKK